jgi:UDP-2,3-diacylglucosamine hydrolase
MTIKNILLEIKPHGDGKGPGDMGYKRMKKYLQIRFLNGFLVGYIPILEFLQYLSVKNKLISGDEDITFLERTRNG